MSGVVASIDNPRSKVLTAHLGDADDRVIDRRKEVPLLGCRRVVAIVEPVADDRNLRGVGAGDRRPKRRRNYPANCCGDNA